MEESAGGGDFYDKVYEAERPELFLKAAGGHRVVGRQEIRFGATPIGTCPSRR
jgi:2-dehydro-3-deoxy-D-arabinonate dehydratase